MSDDPQDVDLSPDFVDGDELGEVNADREEFRIVPAMTAPIFPLEHLLNDSATFFQRMIGGGMDVKFASLVTLPDGRKLPSPEATVIRFSVEGWQQFKRDVEMDGERPQIETVRHLPGGLLNGDPT